MSDTLELDVADCYSMTALLGQLSDVHCGIREEGRKPFWARVRVKGAKTTPGDPRLDAYVLVHTISMDGDDQGGCDVKGIILRRHNQDRETPSKKTIIDAIDGKPHDRYEFEGNLNPRTKRGYLIVNTD